MTIPTPAPVILTITTTIMRILMPATAILTVATPTRRSSRPF